MLRFLVIILISTSIAAAYMPITLHLINSNILASIRGGNNHNNEHHKGQMNENIFKVNTETIDNDEATIKSTNTTKSNGAINAWRRILPTRITEKIFQHFFSIFILDPDILRSCAKVCSFVVWTFMILSFLGTIGVDTKPLLSLLSISGLTIGFAAKDILTNTFAGIFILFTRPFKRGWVISVCGYRGQVLSTDIRYLRMLLLKVCTPSYLTIIRRCIYY